MINNKYSRPFFIPNRVQACPQKGMPRYFVCLSLISRLSHHTAAVMIRTDKGLSPSSGLGCFLLLSGSNSRGINPSNQFPNPTISMQYSILFFLLDVSLVILLNFVHHHFRSCKYFIPPPPRETESFELRLLYQKYLQARTPRPWSFPTAQFPVFE